MAEKENSLPPIFAPSAERAAPSTKPTRSSGVSDRVHRLLTNKRLELTPAAPEKPATSIAAGPTIRTEPGVLMMDKLIVQAPALKLPLRTKPESRLDDFLQHGVFYRSTGRGARIDGRLDFMQVDSNRSGASGVAPKVEIKFNIRW